MPHQQDAGSSASERETNQVHLQRYQIEQVFSQHHVPMRVTQASRDSRSWQFNLHSQLNGGIDKLRALTQDLKRALGSSGVQLNRHGDEWQVHVPHVEDLAVPLLDLLGAAPKPEAATAIVGLTEEGGPVYQNFAQPDSEHVLIAGDSGAGKTILLRTLAISLAMTNRQADVQLLVISPARDGGKSAEQRNAALQPLNYLPHMLADVCTRWPDIKELLDYLVNEMGYRQEQGFSRPRLIVLIDQAATLLERGDRDVTRAIGRLAQDGAEAGIHLVLATSRPRSAKVNTLLHTNLPTRYVGLTADQDVASAAARGLRIQADYLLGEGDFLAVRGGSVVHFQAAAISDYDLHLQLRRLYASTPILLATPFVPRLQMPREDALPPAKRRISFLEQADHEEGSAPHTGG